MLDEHLLQREHDGRELRALACGRLHRGEAPGPGRAEAVAVVEDRGGGAGGGGAAVVAAAPVGVDSHYEGHLWVSLEARCNLGLIGKFCFERVPGKRRSSVLNSERILDGCG